MADRFSKKTVISATLLAQVGGLAVIAYGMYRQSLPISLTGFLFVGGSDHLLLPARYGIIKELVDTRQLGLAIGWIEMLGYSDSSRRLRLENIAFQSIIWRE